MDSVQSINHLHIFASFINDRCLADSSLGIFGFVSLRLFVGLVGHLEQFVEKSDENMERHHIFVNVS